MEVLKKKMCIRDRFEIVEETDVITSTIGEVTQEEQERAILVGVSTREDEAYLDELAELARTAGALVVGRFVPVSYTHLACGFPLWGLASVCGDEDRVLRDGSL